MIDHNNLEVFADPHTYDIEDPSDQALRSTPCRRRRPAVGCLTSPVALAGSASGFAVTGVDIVPGTGKSICYV